MWTLHSYIAVFFPGVAAIVVGGLVTPCSAWSLRRSIDQSSDAISIDQSLDATRLGALPTSHPERVQEICGFDDANTVISEGTPWGQYARKHPVHLQQGRILLYEASHQGTGTRLRGLAYALLLAMQSERALLLDWRGLSAAMRPAFIKWVPPDDLPSGPRYIFGQPDIKDVTQTEIPLVHVEIGCFKPLRRCGWEVLGDPGMQQLAAEQRTSWNLVGCAARFLLRPTDRLGSLLDQGRNGFSVAMQLRFGDHAAFGLEHTTSFGQGMDERLAPQPSSVATMLTCAKNTSTETATMKLFFASDLDQARDWAKQGAGSNMEVVSAMDSPVHTDLNTAGDVGDAEAREVSTWTELLLLGGASRLLLSGSRQVTMDHYHSDLFNSTNAAALCRASGFGMAAASLGLLQPETEVTFGIEDCGLECAASNDA